AKMTPTADTSTAEKERAHEQRMLALASFFDLNGLGDRARSATALVNLFFDLLRSVSPPLFIQAGARDASVSFRAREMLPGARIVAFEPSPYNVKHYSNEFDYEARASNTSSLHSLMHLENCPSMCGDQLMVSPYCGQRTAIGS